MVICVIKKYLFKAFKFFHYGLTYLMLLSLSLSISSFLFKILAKNFYLKFNSLINIVLLLILGVVMFLFTKLNYTPPKYLDHLD